MVPGIAEWPGWGRARAARPAGGDLLPGHALAALSRKSQNACRVRQRHGAAQPFRMTLGYPWLYPPPVVPLACCPWALSSPSPLQPACGSITVLLPPPRVPGTWWPGGQQNLGDLPGQGSWCLFQGAGEVQLLTAWRLPLGCHLSGAGCCALTWPWRAAALSWVVGAPSRPGTRPHLVISWWNHRCPLSPSLAGPAGRALQAVAATPPLAPAPAPRLSRWVGPACNSAHLPPRGSALWASPLCEVPAGWAPASLAAPSPPLCPPHFLTRRSPAQPERATSPRPHPRLQRGRATLT